MGARHSNRVPPPEGALSSKVPPRRSALVRAFADPAQAAARRDANPVIDDHDVQLPPTVMCTSTRLAWA